MTEPNMGRMDRAEVQELWNRRDHLSALEVRCLNELGWMHVALAEAQGELDQAKRSLSEERSRARELWTALANLSFHCDGVVVTCPPPRTVYNQSFAVMDRFKPLYGPEAPKK